MEDLIKLYEKLIGGHPDKRVIIILIALISLLTYKLLEHFLPKFFTWVFQVMRQRFSKRKKGLKTEVRIRTFIANSANTNWISSIRSLGKYNTNVGLIKIFHPLSFTKSNANATSSLNLSDLLFSSESFAILGKPGSGKSSVLNYIANMYANDLAFEKVNIKESRLPILLTLRNIKSFKAPLGQIIADFYTERGCAVTREFIEEKLEHKICVVLLDGLDEITNVDLRKNAVSWIIDSYSSYKGNRFIVSCRDIDWFTLKIPNLDEYYVTDLDKIQSKGIISNWMEFMQGHNKEKLVHLLNHLEHDERIHSFSRNPLLLTILIILSANDLSIPSKRTHVYKIFLSVLLKEWSDIKEHGRTNPTAYIEETLRFLQCSALYLLMNPDKGETIDLNDTETRSFLTGKLREIGTHNQTTEISQLLKEVSNTGIIIEMREGLYSFSNRGFLEYMAACEIAQTEPNTTLNAHFEKDYWYESLLMLFEIKTDKILIENLVSLHHKASSPSYYRMLSEMLFRKLIPAEMELIIQDICYRYFQWSLNRTEVDTKLFANLYRFDQNRATDYFLSVMNTEVDWNSITKVSVAYSGINEPRVVREIEAIFEKLDWMKRKIILQALAGNSYSEDFIWENSIQPKLKEHAIKCLLDKGATAYDNSFRILEDRKKIFTKEQDKLELKKVAIDLLQRFKRPEVLSYLTENISKFDIGLVAYIDEKSDPNMVQVIRNKIIDSKYKKYIKRPLDVFLSLSFIFFLLPLFFLIMLAIRIESKGPIFIKSTRIGYNGLPIYVFRFRTMFLNYSSDVMQSAKHDYRITTIGLFLRNTSLDDLPLLFDVLGGRLSMVGPSLLPVQVMTIGDPAVYKRVYGSFKPGITGLARIRGFENTLFHGSYYGLDEDLRYLYKSSFLMDLYILAQTPKTLILRGQKNAF